ncbi:MAG: hypothetical protein K9G30_04945 [Parvibaculum sp.]|nr:hypothetical protein [Parvibaculum sp.]
MSSTTVHRNSKENIPSTPFFDMHKGVYIATLLAWLSLLAVFWVGFGTNLESEFIVAIATLYILIFFGTPIVMIKVANKFSPTLLSKETFRGFLAKPLSVRTGQISGHDALIQVILVPVCLVLGTAGIAYAFHAARQAAGG